jgi:putative ABC transport system ATP-binding protein
MTLRPVKTREVKMDTPRDTAPSYELEHVARSYGQDSRLVLALDALDLTIKRGEFVAIFGPSGSGKTTLLQLLGALDRPSAGSIRFEGQSLGELNGSVLADLRLRAIGFVFQQFNLIPTLTAAENVAVPLDLAGDPEPLARAARLLGDVGLAERAHHYPAQLSGGEQQRVAIARAVALSPPLLLADEPTGNLDTTTGASIVDLLLALNRERGSTLLLVTHDAALAGRAGRAVALRDGRVVNGRHP